MNNTAGKIIKAQNLLLQVAALNRTRVASPFLLEKENA
jgi:hypothetical protein